MKQKIVTTICLAGVLAFTACQPGADESDPDKAMILNHEDVVIDADADAAETPEAPADAAAAPPPPPGAPPEGLQAAATTLTDEERMAKMSPAEKAQFKEEMQGVWDSAKGEEETHSVLLGDIQQAVEDYHFDNLKPPSNLGQLYQGGYLNYMPKLPAGKKLRIDGKSLKVTLE